MIILKLGGSALTKKDADTPTIDDVNLDRIAKEVSYYNQDMIIVHGAGSYGHIYAKEYAIGDNITSPEDNQYKIEGMCRTQNSMQILNYMVVKKLQENNIPAIGIKPSTFIIAEDTRINLCDLEIIQRYIREGFVPVLYGDAVLDYDNRKKFSILSGDQIITHLAKKLKPERVILASDVDGIFTDNPKKNPDAKLIDIVTKETTLKLTDDDQADVTGGMGGKINELLRLAEEGIESQIINANKKDNIKLAVSGQEVQGTIIK